MRWQKRTGRQRNEETVFGQGKKGDLKKHRGETSLVVQWLRLHAPNSGDLGSIPGQGTRSHMQQLKILHAMSETHQRQINKNKYIYF